MKKKTTRKIRRNKRATTQRRKNRSYKRMKGGVSTGIYKRDENGNVIERRIEDADDKKREAFNTLANTKNIKKDTVLTFDDGATIKAIELNNNTLTWAVYQEEPSQKPTNLFANHKIAMDNMFHSDNRIVSRFSGDVFLGL